MNQFSLDWCGEMHACRYALIGRLRFSGGVVTRKASRVGEGAMWFARIEGVYMWKGPRDSADADVLLQVKWHSGSVDPESGLPTVRAHSC